MTNQKINNRIEFYTNLFIDTVRNFVNTDTDGYYCLTGGNFKNRSGGSVGIQSKFQLAQF